MSTKIYSAYKLKEEINLMQLMQINYQIKEQIISDFISRISITLAVKVDKIMNNLEESAKNEKYSEAVRNTIHRIMKNECETPELALYFRLYDDLSSAFKDISIEQAKMVYIPHNDDIFAMFFSSYRYEKYILQNDNFSDYHYQNQTDQPEDISDEEWEQRKKDWDEAIGPDYIPINHGMLFTFLDYESYDVEKRMIQEFDNAMEKVKEIKAKKQKD